MTLQCPEEREVNVSEQGLREAWQEPAYSDLFDSRAHYSLERLRRVYESFEEFGLLLDHKDQIQGREHVVSFC